ncbi:hypothetical protein GS474_16090 [Rhodococcus hoagii]|nr:hypothetical protein [Prescottella equi]
MALASTLARDWVLEVKISSAWTPVRGLTSVAPIFEGSEQDTSDIDSEGYAASIVTGLAFRIEGSGKRKGDNTSGFVDDPGQNFLRRKGRTTGADNYVDVRIYRRDSLPDAYQAQTTVKWTDSAAGDTNALQEFSFTLSGNGKPQEISKPSTAYTVTIGGGPTGGTFTLSVGGQTTAGIAYNATAAAVKSALEALSTVGTGNANVTGTAGGPYTVSLANGGLLTGSGASLTPSGTVTVTP